MQSDMHPTQQTNLTNLFCVCQILDVLSERRTFYKQMIVFVPVLQNFADSEYVDGRREIGFDLLHLVPVCDHFMNGSILGE